MDVVGRVVGIMTGVAVGGLAGFWIGGRVRGQRRAYWALNVVAVLACAAIDFAGLALGRPWLAYSAVGLMGGLITGMKYGYSDAMRIWRPTDSDGAPADIPAQSSTDSSTEPAAECAEPRA